jgi:hypothetical protein
VLFFYLFHVMNFHCRYGDVRFSYSDTCSRVRALSAPPPPEAVHGDILMLTCLHVMRWDLLTDALLRVPQICGVTERQHTFASLASSYSSCS